MLEFKMLKPTEKNILELERLRRNAYSFSDDSLEEIKSYYAYMIIEGKVFVWGAFLDSALIAGCYVSQSRQSLYIEQLFVRKDVQYHPDLHVGTALIKYVLQHKEEIESFFHASFHDANVEPASQALTGYYEKLGFRNTNDSLNTFRKRI